jgi:predicted RNase H-like HicB family nuclease
MNQYLVIYEPAEDGGWGAYLPDIDGVVAVGETRAEVEVGIRVALEMYIEDLHERGEALPEPRNFAGYVAA